MRHLKRTAKLGRTGQHRNAMLANLVSNLIKHKRVTTTLAKAKAARPVAEKLVTLGKRNVVSARRLAAARLRARGPQEPLDKASRKKWRQDHDVVRILFDEIAPAFKDRNGGYTRIVKMHQRNGDASQLAILEFVELTGVAPEAPEAKSDKETKPAETKPAAETKGAEEEKAGASA
jgi:large subunit ribosomal protein L17